MFSPLEQFEIYKIWSITMNGINSTITNFSITLILIVIFIIYLLIHSSYTDNIIPSRYQLVMELLYNFTTDIIKQQLNMKGMIYSPIILYTFIFLLTCNLYGLIPFGFSVTGHIFLTSFIACTFNLAFFLRIIAINSYLTYKLFIPHGVPKSLLPLIFIIEIMSYMLRTFSLSIRLFANMMAGHISLYTLSSFMMKFVMLSLYIPTIILFIFILLIGILEFAICFIQAYIFVLLLTIYLNDTFIKFER